MPIDPVRPTLIGNSLSTIFANARKRGLALICLFHSKPEPEEKANIIKIKATIQKYKNVHRSDWDLSLYDDERGIKNDCRKYHGTHARTKNFFFTAVDVGTMYHID